MEQYRPLLYRIENDLGINFTKPNNVLLDNLSNQLTKIAKELKVPALTLQIPERGFLNKPMSKDQQKGVDQFLEATYATSAVKLQNNLTSIPIEENHDKVVFLPSVFKNNNISISLSTLPFHEACGEWGGKQRVFWVREKVAERLLKCGQALDSIGVILHIEDAFRPIGVQEGLFLRRAKMILKEHPDWVNDWEKVWTETRSKTAISPFMAGHKSGAALDITLRIKSDGEPLPIGGIYPEGGPKVALYYPYITQEEWNTRQLFVHTMEMGGLRTYPYETWHVSFGDLSAGITAFSQNEVTPNYTAIYGPIETFDSATGEVVPYSIEKRYEPFYSQEELLQIINSGA